MTGHPGHRAGRLATGKVEHLGTQGGQHNWHRARSLHADIRLDPVLLALVVNRLAVEQRPHDRHVLAHVAEVAGIGQTIHVFNHELVGQADAQGKAPLAGRLGCQRLLGHDHRVTRVGRHHGRAQFDPARLASDQPQQADRVVRKRVGQPGRVQAGRLGPLRPLDDLVHRRALSGSFTDHHTDTHACVPPCVDG